MRIYETTIRNSPILSWCMHPEEGALDQARNLASLPFIYRHVALMPDTHQGYGMPIGGVVATQGVIIPNAVGVDIGCGMCAVKSSLTDVTTEQLKKILGGSEENQGGIRGNIPVGRNRHKKDQDELLMPDNNNMVDWCETHYWDEKYNSVVQKEYNSALKQLGTLGGGNHFIEIQKGDDGFVWIMIHSGSRNLGYTVAKHYNKVAQDLCKLWYSDIPEYKGEDGLAFLPIGTEEASNYIREMNYCIEFAHANRLHMLDNVIRAFFNAGIDCIFDKEINIAHNYAQLENHFGKNVWIHRKGATSAKEGELGIIPGSQGTSSYIVKGKGNRDSFNSCSHGAGRKMSRKKARNELSLEDEQKMLNDQGILHALRGKGGLDEAPGAYKDVKIVMEEQKDLVEIVVKLTPLAVVKG
jgi:tRNA-splicing ligase RtcB